MITNLYNLRTQVIERVDTTCLTDANAYDYLPQVPNVIARFALIGIYRINRRSMNVYDAIVQTLWDLAKHTDPQIRRCPLPPPSLYHTFSQN
jgi:hypothetical protein